MSESLVVRLDAAPSETAAWVAVDPTGALLGPPGRGPVADAVMAASGRQVIALLPAVDVLRTRVEVPVKTGSKLLQALPFALEESLTEDVEDLHFAAGNRDGQGKVAVAIVRRAAMDRFMSRMREAGITPARVYSEADALGTMPNTATLLLQPDGALLADTDGEVSVSDTEDLDAFLQLWQARRMATTETAAPLHLVVYGTPQLLSPLDDLWDAWRSRIESLDVRAMPEGVLPRLAAQIVTTPGINLLQGAFAQRGSLAGYWPAWRLSAALLAALAVMAGGVYWLELQRMRAEVSALDSAIEQAFRYVFPDAGPVADARTALSARLQQLGDRSGGGSNDFLDALRIIAQASANAGSTRIEGINYRTGTLELRLRAPSVEVLDQIQQQVVQAGLQAQIQSANAAGDGVVGRLQIAGPGG